MFGFGRRKTRQLSEPLVLPTENPDPKQAVTLLKKALPAAGHSFRQVGPATLAVGAGADGVAVTFLTDAQPLRFDATVVFDCVFDAYEFDTIWAKINAWNCTRTDLNAFSFQEPDGHVRIAAQSIYTAEPGISARQLDIWVRKFFAAIDTFATEVRTDWPEAPRDGLEVELPEVPVIPAAPASSEDLVAELDELATPGNVYGLLGGDSEPLNMDRLGTAIERVTGAKPKMQPTRNGREGMAQASWNGTSVDVSLRNQTLSVTSGASFGEQDNEAFAYLLSRAAGYNINDTGLVAVVNRQKDKSSELAVLSTARHTDVSAGLSDAQLASALLSGCQLTTRVLDEILTDIRADQQIDES